jgi:formylmethanofuran dehydrogenase subunit A
VVEQGEVRQDLYGRTLHVAPAYDEERVHDIQKWFESCYTIQFANYPVDSSYMAHGGTAVECQPKP